MHPKIPELEIPPGDPFANDKLNRRESGKILAAFLGSVGTPYVLAINAAWGQGKTSFLFMWRKLLEKDELSKQAQIRLNLAERFHG